MRSTFVIGYDASPAANAALHFMSALADHAGARLLAAYVYPRPGIIYGDPMMPTLAADLWADEERAEDLAARVLDEIAEPVERIAIPGDSVPRELHALALREHAAVLGVGLTRRGAGGRLLPGSVGERLVHGSPCPVLVVPGERAGATLDSIAAAYDGSYEARQALRVARALAVRTGARLRLLTAVPERYASLHDHGLGAAQRHAEERLAREVEVQSELLVGSAGPSLAEACASDADLLVTGSRGYGAVRSVLLGATSRFLVDHAPCPVLVVPRSARRPVVRELESAGTEA